MDSIIQLLQQMNIDPKLLVGIIGAMEGLKSIDKKLSWKPFYYYIQAAICLFVGIITTVFTEDILSSVFAIVTTAFIYSGATTLIYLYGVKLIKGFYDKYLQGEK